MRNPNRLDAFYEEWRELHKSAFPDWRFGQLMYNFIYWLGESKGIDCFFPEEARMLELFREYANGVKYDTF